jgi:hypothetical protein
MKLSNKAIGALGFLLKHLSVEEVAKELKRSKQEVRKLKKEYGI